MLQTALGECDQGSSDPAMGTGKGPQITTRSRSKHHMDWKQSLQKPEGKSIMADSLAVRCS